MNCRELVELVTDYLEGKLPSDDVARFEVHIATCEGCTGYLEQMQKTIQITGLIHPDDITKEQYNHLLAIFRDWKSS